MTDTTLRLQIRELVPCPETDVVDSFDPAAVRNDILFLARKHAASRVLFDLSGVRLVSSDFLGLLIILSREKLKVALKDVASEIRDVLSATHLDRLLEIESE